MPYLVETSFDQFYDAINLGGDHRSTANGRRDDIVAKLGKSFDIIEFFSTGSIPKFTALKDHADLDVMVALHWSKHIKDKTPAQVIQLVRDALAQWRTGVRKNGQAVTLTYTTWPNVDVVPVYQTKSGDVVQHYNVPDINRGIWIPARPKQFAATIEDKSTECGYNFRRIIKMMKHWNRIHSDYLQSYHIEVLALKALSGNLDETPWKVFQFFKDAQGWLAGPVHHDTGFADEYLSWNDRQEVLQRFKTAEELARAAWYSTHGTNTDHEAAIAKWRQIFGDKFPTYG
jgi:hypothetical protein